MEQSILELQTENAALELRITELEAEVEELEEPVAMMRVVTDTFNQYLGSSESSSQRTPAAISSSGTIDPKWSEKASEREKGAPVTKIILSKEHREALAGEPDKLSSMARVIPWKNSDGYVEGYRLSGIRRESVPYQMGFKNGDILIAMNGKPLYPFSEAGERYQEIQKEETFRVLLIRRNKNILLQYIQEE